MSVGVFQFYICLFVKKTTFKDPRYQQLYAYDYFLVKTSHLYFNACLGFWGFSVIG